MIGYCIKECKGAKVKNLSILVNSTKSDTLILKKFVDFSNEMLPDFFVQNGMKKKTRKGNEYYETIEKISQSNNIPILMRELPVLREMCSGNMDKKTSFSDRWWKLSWNSFFMDEGLHPYDPSYDRWDQLKKEHNISVYDWKSRGDYVLFCLQMDGDSALNRLIYNNISYKEYCKEVINKLKSLTDRTILVRNHPLDPNVTSFLKRNFQTDSRVIFSTSLNLYDDLNQAHCMVTYNSTSCVESVLYGVPTIVLDPSAMATPVANKLEDIETLKDFDRHDWLNRIAFMQWQGKEMTDGYLWNLLKQAAGLK